MKLSDVQSWVTLIKDIITGLAVPVTAWFAYQGLSTWRRQLKGNTDFELSRMVLRAVYKLRDAISYVRSPIMTGGEISEALKEAGIEVKESDPDFQWRRSAAVYDKRLNQAIAARSELQVAAVEAEAVWGNDASEKILLLNKPYIELVITLQQFHGLLKKQPGRHYTERDAEWMAKYSLIVYSGGDGENLDEYDNKLSQSIQEIENYVSGKIKR